MRQTKEFDVRQLSHLSDEAFIHHCFVRAIRQVCNPSRAMDYLTLLANGTARGVIFEIIYQENDYSHQINTAALRNLPLLDGVPFIREAYRIFLGRPVDQGGLEHYLERLSKGEKKLNILYDLATSSEGQVRQASHKDLSDFVNFLKRDDIPLGSIKLKEVQRLISLEGDELIIEAYNLFLRRESDPAGLVAYQQALQKGTKKIKILHSLAFSSEGRKHQKTLPVWLYLMLGRFV